MQCTRYTPFEISVHIFISIPCKTMISVFFLQYHANWQYYMRKNVNSNKLFALKKLFASNAKDQDTIVSQSLHNQQKHIFDHCQQGIIFVQFALVYITQLQELDQLCSSIQGVNSRLISTK